MLRKAAPWVVAAATAGLAVLLLARTPAAGTTFAVLAVCLPILLLVLAEPGRGSARLLIAAVVSAAVLLAGGFVAITVLSGARSTDPPAAGLLVQVLVMTLAPLVVLGVLYALDFGRFVPRDEQLERLRAVDADSD